jgi:putative PIG3 family NAD(P)H quinone oxidoreductase
MDGHGSADVLRIGKVQRPRAGKGQVLIAVAAAGVNRPDIIQREGRYPPPPSESEILGLEAAGRVVEVGEGVGQWHVGDRVTALLAGGGYAEYAAAYAAHVMAIPHNIAFAEAACIPEAYITAYQNIFLNAGFRDGETLLAHGGGGGVNTAAIQICRALCPNSRVIVTCSPGKLERVKAVGADEVIDYRNEDFAERVRALTNKRGADVILDHIGASYFEQNMTSLAIGGRLAIIATLGGREAKLDLARLMVKRQSVIGSVLRSRPIDEKSAIVARFNEAVMPHVANGDIRPLVHEILPLERADDAHRHMEASQHFGKIVLRVSDTV